MIWRLQVVEETDDVYLLLEPTNIIKAIGDAMDLDLVKVRYTARELKNLVAKTRKQNGPGQRKENNQFIPR